MSVKALKPYKFPAKDVRANFPAPLLFIGWEDHLMFCSPVALPLRWLPLSADSSVLPEPWSGHSSSA